MMRLLKELFGEPVYTVDGKYGNVSDVYFNDSCWSIEYFVVVIDTLLFDKHVLVEPTLISIDINGKINSPLSKSGMRFCHDYDTKKPFYRQMEENERGIDRENVTDKNAGMHLRSAAKLMTYRIMTHSGKIGMVTNFLTDDRQWKVDRLIASVDDDLFETAISNVKHIGYHSSMIVVT